MQDNMKKTGLVIFMLTVLTMSCQLEKNKEKVSTTDSVSNDEVKDPKAIDKADSAENSHKAKDFDKLDMTFAFENKEQRFKQMLGVTWLTNDSIEFRLLSEDDLCDTDYWGYAKNIYPDMDPESDEDENGESYSASEYITEEDTYSLKIRISLDKDRARIIFTDKSGEDTDCIPTPDLILVEKRVK
jgi:hypothetical protein